MDACWQTIYTVLKTPHTHAITMIIVVSLNVDDALDLIQKLCIGWVKWVSFPVFMACTYTGRTSDFTQANKTLIHKCVIKLVLNMCLPLF